MSNALNVFFDTETLIVNEKAKPRLRKACVYVVSYEYWDTWDTGEKVKKVAPTLQDMLEDLCTLGFKSINLIAHNGEGYDFHFLRRELIDMYGLLPENEYLPQAVDNSLQTRIKDEGKNDYLLEARVKSKTRLELKFRIHGVKFSTLDTYPRFNASVRTIGELLEHHGIIDASGKKLNYDEDYTKYNRKEDMSWSELRRYCRKVYDQLDEHALKYVGNDTSVIFEGWYNFDKLFPNFDVTKRTLSMNVMDVYTVNDLAYLQILNKFGSDYHDKISYTDYQFNGENFFDYVHHYYKGGLNFYNDRYVGVKVHDLIHLDLNSSYPSVMHFEKFPTFLKEAKVINDDLKLEDKYYYHVQITKKSFNAYIKAIPSRVVRQMLVKYFNNPTPYVWLQTPTIDLLGKFLGKKITHLPAISYLKWKAEFFGGREVINHYYSEKTRMKKAHYSSKAVYTTKVILNGIYGIPALRAHYNLFQLNRETGEYINQTNGFKNSERNLVFAGSVTSYALRKLLTPLTYNVEGVDDAFIYADTDSLFLRRSYWQTIKSHVHTDPYELGAWGVEHEKIDDFYILNHKKYALRAYGKNEVYAGGIPKDAFTKLGGSFDDFIKYQFHDGAQIPNLRNVYSVDGVIILYEALTSMSAGSKYPDHYTQASEIQNLVDLELIRQRELELQADEGIDDTLFYETPYGSISIADAFPYKNDADCMQNLNNLIIVYNRLDRTINKEIKKIGDNK